MKSQIIISLQLVAILCAPIVGVVTSINIALHAQASPNSGDKIVGSVVTTDGLRAAFAERFDIDRSEVFYPFEYHNFNEVRWDLLIIEGWYDAITHLIVE